jgi:hypothetical protein
MLMQELLEYWALIIDITQRSLPNMPWILLHVSAMDGEIMNRVKKKLRYCRDPYILWIQRVYAFAIVEIQPIFRILHKISL